MAHAAGAVDHHQRIQAARERYLEAIAVERMLFDARFVGDTFQAKLENFNRWVAQQSKVVEALDEFDAATKAYLAAIAER